MIKGTSLSSVRTRRLVATVLLGVATAATLGPVQASATKGGGNTVLTNDVVTFVNSYPGKSARYFGGGHANDVTVDISGSDIVFTDTNAVGLSTSSPCTLVNSTTVSCPKVNGPLDSDKVFAVSVIGNGGDDTLTAEGWSWVYGSTYNPIGVTLSGFDGNDTLTANGGYSWLVGGTGNDTLTSGPGTTTGLAPKDRILGQQGDDTIETVTNSSDLDGIECDPQGDLNYEDWLTRNSYDVDTYYTPFELKSTDCDHTTIV